MPLLDVQQRQATVYRIRFGAQIPTSNGKKRPAKLTEQIRVTALNPNVIDAFIDVYGGERKEWRPDEHRVEWEVYLPTTWLSIVLLPGQSLSQWWELWKGTVCQRRCDGVTDTKSKKDCLCPSRDPAERTAAKGECNPVTRVHVICPDVKVIGAGMMISNGLIAAETLPESIANADAALRLGYFVPATLTVVEHRGLNHFVVPRIETVGISMEQMMLEAGEQREQGAIGQASRTVLGGAHPRFTPAGELAAPAQSVREQLGDVEGAAVPSGRANAAEPLRATGLAPRPVEGDPGLADNDDEVYDAEVVHDDRIAPSTQSLAIKAREAGLDDDGRHDLAEWASSGRSRSTKDLSDPERKRARDALDRIEAGSARLDRDEQGTMHLRDARFGWKTDTPPPAAADAPAATPGAGMFTAEQIAAMAGRELVDALMGLGLSPAGKPEELRARLMEACGVGGEKF